MRRDARRVYAVRRAVAGLVVLGLVAGGWRLVSLAAGRAGSKGPKAAGSPRPSPSGSGQGSGAVRPPFIKGAKAAAKGHTFDLVIKGGRVIDPESGFDHVADVGVDGGTITQISDSALSGRKVVDATGKVVAPGFIDLLSYDPNPYGIWFKVADGVTTNLAMNGIGLEAAKWFDKYAKAAPPTNFGAAFDDPLARAKLGVEPGKAASAAQIGQLVAQAEQSLRDGYIGVDVEPEFTPGIDTAEIVALSKTAAKFGVPVFFRGRYSDPDPPGTNAETIAEIVAAGRTSGAGVNAGDIISTGGLFSMKQSLDAIDKARSQGVDITASTYPYDFWGAYMASNRFNPGWQKRYRINFDDIVLAGTSEHVTEQTFDKYRRENRLAVAFGVPEDDLQAALKAPSVIISSDSMLEPGANNFSRGAGTFSRVLGKYVRDEEVLTLKDALVKMTVLPAKRVERGAPAMKKKGRIQIGADADITIFDPDTVIDKATVESPAQESVGIVWVIVNGAIVKDTSGLHKDVLAGKPVRYVAPRSSAPSPSPRKS
jgi:amidohydrolase family protein